MFLHAENFTVDASLSEMFYINFSSPVHEYIFCYENENLCLCLSPENETHSHPLIHEVS